MDRSMCEKRLNYWFLMIWGNDGGDGGGCIYSEYLGVFSVAIGLTRDMFLSITSSFNNQIIMAPITNDFGLPECLITQTTPFAIAARPKSSSSKTTKDETNVALEGPVVPMSSQKASKSRGLQGHFEASENTVGSLSKPVQILIRVTASRPNKFARKARYHQLM